MFGRYRDKTYDVVEADMTSEGLERVRAKFDHLCECYVPNDTDALRKLFSLKRISRCYTFLPADMSAELRQFVLSQEGGCWEIDHFAENVIVRAPNIVGGTMVWRYVSQYCLKERLLQFLRSDTRNICVLGGGYDGEAIERHSQDCNGTWRIGDLLCFGEVMLKDAIPMVLDSEYFDTFGFMTRLPAMLPDVEQLPALSSANQHADEVILASSHIFMEMHQGESICIMDLAANL